MFTAVTDESRKEDVFFGMQAVDNSLFELNTMISVLYTAMEGQDEVSNEAIQAYMAVMQERTDAITQDLNDIFINIRQLIEKAPECGNTEGQAV